MGNLVEKKQVVAELKEKFEKASGYYFIDFEKMNVVEVNNLRKLFIEKQIEYRVAKNTLIEIALEEVGMKFDDTSFIKGSTGIAFSYGDPLAPAKVLKPILDKSEKPKFKAAVVEGEFYAQDQLKTLASLPTKAELIAGILGSLNSPISGIVGSINAVMRDLASVIEESAKKRSA
jgi:large subunit ribosomal protein L10